MKADRPAARPLFTYLLYRQPSIIVKTRIPMRFRRMKMNAGRSSQIAGRKKIHGLRSFRRGFHVGSPLERFHHSLAEYNGFFYELRTTNTSHGLFARRVTEAAAVHPTWRQCVFVQQEAGVGEPFSLMFLHYNLVVLLLLYPFLIVTNTSHFP